MTPSERDKAMAYDLVRSGLAGYHTSACLLGDDSDCECGPSVRAIAQALATARAEALEEARSLTPKSTEKTE